MLLRPGKKKEKNWWRFKSRDSGIFISHIRAQSTLTVKTNKKKKKKGKKLSKNTMKLGHKNRQF